VVRAAANAAITLAVYLCQQHGLGSLRFADLLTS
jgi:hypothetical protein